jgi:surfeit locus 1 family protein
MEMRDRRIEARIEREKEVVAAIKKRFHKPHWFAWVFIIFAVGFLLSLSFWQMERLVWKKGLISEITSHQMQRAKPLPQDVAILKKMGFARVLLQGEFLHDDEIHLAARYYNSQLGYHILTPFQLVDGRIVLLNRGWVPANQKDDSKRKDLKGKQTVVAMIRTDNDRNYFTPENNVLKNVWFWRDLPAVEKATGYAIVPVNVDLLYNSPKNITNGGGLPIASDGLVQLRNDHLGYAITWSLIAFCGAVIFFYRHYYVPVPMQKS